MENQNKDFCPVESVKEDETGGKWTILLIIIVVVLLFCSTALAYLIFWPNLINKTVEQTQPTPTTVLVEPTESLGSDKIEDIEKALDNSEVENFDSELQDIEQDLEQL